MAELLRADTPDDRRTLAAALEPHGLPTDDLLAEDISVFRLVVDSANAGYGGLESHGTDALLRSVVVLPQHKGMGRTLVALLEQEAAARGMAEIHLLTTTAAGFFRKLRYREAERDSAPLEIRQSREFASLCPGSAVYLRKRLG